MTGTVDLRDPSPQLANRPRSAGKRLIDAGMLHYEASVAGLAERYGRGETSHTIHVWWARRPHSAMRALVFASLCKAQDEEATNVLAQLGKSPQASAQAVNEAREMLRQQYGRPPRLLDMFGGGGTIGLESARLGAATYSVDSNQLSVFIQRCNLVYSQQLGSRDICKLVRDSGRRILAQLAQESEPLFPLRMKSIAAYADESVFGYIWTYSQACRACGMRYLLSKRPWLSKKSGRNLALRVSSASSGPKVEITSVDVDYAPLGVWLGDGRRVRCPACGEEATAEISAARDELVALIRGGGRSKGKQYEAPLPNASPTPNELQRLETTVLASLGSALPNTTLPKWSGIVNPALYGIETHSDFLNPRQRVVLLLLIKALIEEHKRLGIAEGPDVARYAIAVLSSLIDQLVDWNCRLSMWIPQNEQVGRAFCGPGVAMIWDYAETDPVLAGPANLWKKLDRIVAGMKSIGELPGQATVSHASALELPLESDHFDAIVTDPPYYDNIYYSVLADFFYTWKRLLLVSIEPQLFNNESTDYRDELVASTRRNGSPQSAHQAYCTRLAKALREAERVLRPDGVMSFIYSHSSLQAWEALLQAFRATRFCITSVQPLSIERRQRPRAMTSEAVNTCLAFVARKGGPTREPSSLAQLLQRLSDISDSGFASSLLAAGWHAYDVGIALFAQGVAQLCNASQCEGCASDAEALMAMEDVVRARMPDFKVVRRASL